MPVHHTDGVMVPDKPRLVLGVRWTDEGLVVTCDVSLVEMIVVGGGSADRERSVVIVMANGPHPDATATSLPCPIDSVRGTTALRGPPQVILHSPMASEWGAPPSLVLAAASLDYACATVSRQMLKHKPQPPAEVYVSFHMVGHVLVQKHRMIRRTVPEEIVVPDRVGWKVERGARHVSFFWIPHERIEAPEMA